MPTALKVAPIVIARREATWRSSGTALLDCHAPSGLAMTGLYFWPTVQELHPDQTMRGP